MIHKVFSGATTGCGVIHRGDDLTSGGCQATPLWITLCSFIIQGADFFVEGAGKSPPALSGGIKD